MLYVSLIISGVPKADTQPVVSICTLGWSTQVQVPSSFLVIPVIPPVVGEMSTLSFFVYIGLHWYRSKCGSTNLG